MNSTFALNWLNHNSNCVFSASIFECLKIIIRCIRETVSHRTKSNLTSITRLACSGHSTKRSTVEAHFCCYNVIFVRTVLFNTILSCHFNHGFICLCTRVLIKNLIHTNSCTNLFCKQCLRNCVWIVKGMHNIRYLILYSSNYFLITVTSRVNCDTCIKI